MNRYLREETEKHKEKLSQVFDEKKRTQFKDSILKRKELQQQLLLVVENLIEDPVEKGYLEDQAAMLDPASYQDVVEERAIQRLCGYPLCTNQLSQVPKQQFKISVKSRKVYDITDRKNYCCNGCYEASSHLKNQLLTTPIWLRNLDEKLPLTFKPHGRPSNLVGEEFPIHIRISPKEVEFHSVLDAVSGLSEDVKDMTLDAEEKEPTPSEERHAPWSQTHPKKHSGKKSAHSVGENGAMCEKSVKKESEEKSKCSVEKLNQNDGKETTQSSLEDSVKTAVAETSVGDVVIPRNMTDLETGSERLLLASGDLVENELERSGRLSAQETVRFSDVQTKVGCGIESQKEAESFERRAEIASPFKTEEEPHKYDQTFEEGVAVPTESSGIVQTDSVTHKEPDSRRTKEPLKIPPEGITAPSKKIEKTQPDPEELPSLHVEKTLQEWFTVNALRYVISNTVVDEILAEREHANSLRPEEREEFEEKYAQLCQRLDETEAAEGLLDLKVDGDSENVQNLRPLPSYQELKIQMEETKGRVAAFMSGKYIVDNPLNKLEIKEKDASGEEEGHTFRLPLMDSRGQTTLRRQIVLSRLQLVVQDLMRTFNLETMDIMEHIRDLVRHFQLSSGNIVHEPHHWSLIGLSLIYFVSRHDPVLKRKIAADSPQKYIKMMLFGFGLDSGYLDRLLTWLTDITLKRFA